MSLINVNAIEPSTGTDITLGASGDTTTVPSGATLDISSATLTPPATMPASSGVNFTALNASNLGSGTVPAARLSGVGITHSSQWRVTTNFTSDAEPIASNWEVSDATGYASLGADLTESSGIFTFPATGYWLITFICSWYYDGDSRWVQNVIRTTTNDSSYVEVAEGYTFISQISGGASYQCNTVQALFDVTDTANCKVQFQSRVEDNSVTTMGNSSIQQTGVTFTRLGDT